MTQIQQNLAAIKGQLPAGVELVAVSKFHPVEALLQAYEAGQRVFGESRAQELVVKFRQMPSDTRFHFIGHLQRNKVRVVVPCVSMIESVDSVSLLKLIDEEAGREGRNVNVLLEVRVATEAAKTGFEVDALLSAAAGGELSGFGNVRICGLMAMASFTDDMEQVAREFDKARAAFLQLKHGVFHDCPEFCRLSMGMTDDWQVAVNHGSTMVRIGTAIFGSRQ